MIAFFAFLATVPAANWLVGNAGTVCVPDGPCLVPVGFGLMAPSGVLVIGFAFVLRDQVHRTLGAKAALLAIAVGAALSAMVAPPGLVVASAMTLLAAELLDFAIYAPLYRRRLILAVLLSSAAGIAVDSVMFLWLAFGSLDHLSGQIVGKLWAVAAATAFIWVRERTAVRAAV